MVRRWRLIGYFPILYNPPREATAGTAGIDCGLKRRLRSLLFRIFFITRSLTSLACAGTCARSAPSTRRLRRLAHRHRCHSSAAPISAHLGAEPVQQRDWVLKWLQGGAARGMRGVRAAQPPVVVKSQRGRLQSHPSEPGNLNRGSASFSPHVLSFYCQSSQFAPAALRAAAAASLAGWGCVTPTRPPVDESIAQRTNRVSILSVPIQTVPKSP
jgi:hypothetical protein